MKLFLDTANLDEIREAAEIGLIDGVTTNPSLVAKQGLSREKVIEEICALVDGPISAEVIGTEFDDMVSEAKDLAAIHDNIVVKVPLTQAGLKTVYTLTPEGIGFNVTLCFSVAQALLAAKVGARLISPFVGRWDDINQHGIEMIPDMVAIYENYGYETEILVASVRSPLHVTEAAIAGADVATIPYKVLKQMIAHPLTDIGLEKFLHDYHASQK
jgi:transaldolase